MLRVFCSGISACHSPVRLYPHFTTLCVHTLHIKMLVNLKMGVLACAVLSLTDWCPKKIKNKNNPIQSNTAQHVMFIHILFVEMLVNLKMGAPVCAGLSLPDWCHQKSKKQNFGKILIIFPVV